MIFLILYFTINVLLKKLDSLNKEESEKKWVNYLSKIMNNFPRWIFIVIEIYISISILIFSDKVELVLKSIFLLVIIIFAIKIIIKCVDFSLEKFFRKDKTAKKSIETIVTVLVWAL